MITRTRHHAARGRAHGRTGREAAYPVVPVPLSHLAERVRVPVIAGYVAVLERRLHTRNTARGIEGVMLSKVGVIHFRLCFCQERAFSSNAVLRQQTVGFD